MATAKPNSADRRTVTNWDNFVNAQLQIVSIRGEGYKPLHRRDNGTHTQFHVKDSIDSILAEIKRQNVNGSGGGFAVTLALNPKPWKGWKMLEEAGVECLDIRSAVDTAKVVGPPFHPAQLQALCQPMQDGNRRIRTDQKGSCWITLSFQTTALTAEDLDEVA